MLIICSAVSSGSLISWKTESLGASNTFCESLSESLKTVWDSSLKLRSTPVWSSKKFKPLSWETNSKSLFSSLFKLSSGKKSIKSSSWSLLSTIFCELSSSDNKELWLSSDKVPSDESSGVVLAKLLSTKPQVQLSSSSWSSKTFVEVWVKVKNLLFEFSAIKFSFAWMEFQDPCDSISNEKTAKIVVCIDITWTYFFGLNLNKYGENGDFLFKLNVNF